MDVSEIARSLLLGVDPAQALGWKAEPPQSQFLKFTDVDEALYGGARQGGKSDALLIFSIKRRTEHRGSKGLILRRMLSDLSNEGAADLTQPRATERGGNVPYARTPLAVPRGRGDRVQLLRARRGRVQVSGLAI